MVNQKFFSFLAALFILFSSSPVFSQDAGGGDNQIIEESMRDISIVAACAAGGLILGLSTLSFVDEPKEHFKSVVVGGALGIILGVGIVVYSQATKSSRIYYESAWRDALPDKGFSTANRVGFNQSKIWRNVRRSATNYSPLYLKYSFTF